MTATQDRTDTRPTATTTVVTRIRDRAAATPSDVALRSKDFGLWQETSWAEYWDEIQDVAHALLALGVARGDRVAIQSENRKEWLTVDLGAVAIGAATVGIYPTNPAAEVVHLLSDSGAKVLLSEDQEQVDKALEVSDRTPDRCVVKAGTLDDTSDLVVGRHIFTERMQPWLRAAGVGPNEV